MTATARQRDPVQRLAADPAGSFALEAGAGSGKTTVLVDRFLRLCLSDPGVDPRAVLAITFTRKATVEIQSRLQAEACRLANLRGQALTEALAEILDRPPRPAERERAAWFHEVLLEDPAGLGIDTLHAFCQKILGRFAAEAGLDPRFAVLDERGVAEYRAEALDRLELELARDPEAAASYAALADTAAGARGKVAALFARRMHLQRWLDRVAPPPDSIAAARRQPLSARLEALLADLQQALLEGTPWAGVAHPRPDQLAPAVAAALADLAGRGIDALVAVDAEAGVTAGLRDQADGLRAGTRAAADRLAAAPDEFPAVAGEVWSLLVTEGGKLRVVNGRQATKAERQAVFARIARPVLDLLALPRLLDLLARNRALLGHGLRALDLYAEAKRRDGVVDFQDLEDLALRLLRDPAVGPAIHFRLDARLDHLLLDEFQDTNRNQWDLLQPLVAELLAGGDPPRTVFAVGDVKQSIYGFRGAESAVFGEASARIIAAAGPGAARRLPANYRSLPALVDAVGDLFTRSPLAGYLGPAAAGVRQEWRRAEDQGTVLFVEPFEADGERGGHERAAAAVVDLVRHLLAGGVATWRRDPGGAVAVRPLRHDDILILARTKTHLATYETALRRAGVPFTPAGRGLLARSREVQDLLALLRWLNYPADDTAGATVLRSPLCRLPEADVQALLAARLGGRRRSLREVLRDGTPPGSEAVACLDGWFRAAGLLPLHDLVRRIFREGAALERAETAWGEQARFNLLRVVDLALAAEARGGSLRDFVAELEQADRLGGEEEGALPGEAGTGRVRVMTVHGAKGLEAPVVILADAAAPLRESSEALALGSPAADGPWIHDVRTADHAGPLLAGGEALTGPLADPRAQALARLRAAEAHILYVAMTRARDRLYVLGGRGPRDSGTSARSSFLGWLAEADTADPARTRWRTAAGFLTEIAPASGAAAAATASPDVPRQRAQAALARLVSWTPPPLGPRLQLERPSALDDDRAPAATRQEPADEPETRPAPPSCRDDAARRRGTRIHAWLERACVLGALPTPGPADAERRAEWEEARAVCEDRALAWIFAPGDHEGRGLSEVPVVQRLSGGATERRLLGYVDRLVLRPGRIDIVDYKSNRFAPADQATVVDLYRPQLAAYRAALTELYPGREVHCWLLWTDPARAQDRLTEVVG